MATATNGSTTLSFKYDANGLRASKTVGGVEHNYYYYGGKLLRETYGSNILDFYYDASGVPYMLEYNGTVYYYVTNAQGDVIQIVNASGTPVADYEYDPYGVSLIATGTLATINPLRYRGYYFDTESGLYYLQSRYYDPNTGRFLNADAFASTGQGLLGNNMFAYCNNNPTNSIDQSGYMPGFRFSNWFSVTAGDMLGMLLVGGAVIYAGSTASSASSTIIQDAIEEIKDWVNTRVVQEEYRDNSVYKLVDDKGLVRYVGRTNNPDRRFREHAKENSTRAQYKMVVLATGLTKSDAMLLEQVLISTYTLNYLDNARREISVKNINGFVDYADAITELNTGISLEAIFELIKTR